jgi:hypothetical protein
MAALLLDLRLHAESDRETYAKRRKHVRVESLPVSASFIGAISAIGDGMPIHNVVENARNNVIDGLDKDALKYLASVGSILIWYSLTMQCANTRELPSSPVAFA